MKKHNSKYVCGRFAYRTDIGKVRLSNEDQAIATINSAGNVLLIVCDGMGGQNKGDFASSLAVKSIVESFRKKNKFHSQIDAGWWLRKAIQNANKDIYNESKENKTYDGMGTTLTLALIVKNNVLTAQVGDSRMYFVDQIVREFKQISEDQTYVAYLYRTGQITKEEMKTHPKRHMLMNALGIYPSASADIKVLPYNNQTILLCSDGLYNNVPDIDISSIIKGEDTTEEKINELISLANANGGSDNIAVVLWEAIQ